jgi:hypothetical protein
VRPDRDEIQSPLGGNDLAPTREWAAKQLQFFLNEAKRFFVDSVSRPQGNYFDRRFFNPNNNPESTDSEAQKPFQLLFERFPLRRIAQENF